MALFKKLRANIKEKGGLKNVVAVGQSILKGKGVTANIKNEKVKKLTEKALGSVKGIATTALVGAVGATGVKAGIKAVKASKAVKATNLMKGQKVTNLPTQSPSSITARAPNQPQYQTNYQKTTSAFTSGGYRMKRKKTALWYKRQTELIKAKKEYYKARGL